MAIVHMLLIKFKTSTDAATVRDHCNRLLDLKAKCIHADNQQPYILNVTGGENNSKEGISDGFTHGFSIIFDSESDRDYYIEQDTHHREVAQALRSVSEKVTVVDYEPHVF